MDCTGRTIRKLRRMAGIRQVELAVKSGIKKSRISAAENGHTKLRDEEIKVIQEAIAITEALEMKSCHLRR